MVLIALAILSFFAVSDNIFFTTMKLKPDNVVIDLKGEGYELSFYMCGNADSENKVKIATVFHDVEKSGENMAHIILKIIPEDHLKVDTLNLEFMMLQPTSALTLENPEDGQSIPYVYTRTGNNSSVKFDFPNLDAGTSESITIDFWLDLLEIDTTEDKLLVTSFSIYEESVFKIVKYHANSAIEVDISFITQ
jgi:hypothetical protein